MGERERPGLAALVDDLKQTADVIAVRVRQQHRVQFAQLVAQLLRCSVARVN